MCEHSCSYCFMKRNRPLPPLRLELKELKVNLGEGNFIFVGSSTDEWAANVPSEWIEQVLDYCDGFNNRYLFQSKNPARFLEYLEKNHTLSLSSPMNFQQRILIFFLQSMVACQFLMLLADFSDVHRNTGSCSSFKDECITLEQGNVKLFHY